MEADMLAAHESPLVGAANHIAFIMDGNGRHGEGVLRLNRLAGHKAGVETVEGVTEWCMEFGIEYVTLFAFSTENWRRSEEEVKGIFNLFRSNFGRRGKRKKLLKEGVRMTFIGDREDGKVPQDVLDMMCEIEEESKGNTRLHLTIALNYGGQNELLRAAQFLVDKASVGDLSGPLTIEAFEAAMDTGGLPPVDMVVRTGGDARISNFLLWLLAYAQIRIVDEFWPVYDRECFVRDLAWFASVSEDRRFGGVRVAAE